MFKGSLIYFDYMNQEFVIYKGIILEDLNLIYDDKNIIFISYSMKNFLIESGLEYILDGFGIENFIPDSYILDKNYKVYEYDEKSLYNNLIPKDIKLISPNLLEFFKYNKKSKQYELKSI